MCRPTVRHAADFPSKTAPPRTPLLSGQSRCCPDQSPPQISTGAARIGQRRHCTRCPPPDGRREYPRGKTRSAHRRPRAVNRGRCAADHTIFHIPPRHAAGSRLTDRRFSAFWAGPAQPLGWWHAAARKSRDRPAKSRSRRSFAGAAAQDGAETETPRPSSVRPCDPPKVPRFSSKDAWLSGAQVPHPYSPRPQEWRSAASWPSFVCALPQMWRCGGADARGNQSGSGLCDRGRRCALCPPNAMSDAPVSVKT